MKPILFTLLLLTGATIAFAQQNENFTGSGKVVRREVPVSAFNTLDASGMYALVLHAGDKPSVVVETDDNLQELFEVKQEGNTVHIDMKTRSGKGINFRSRTTMVVHVTAPALEQLDLNLMGATSTEGMLRYKELRVNNKSMGQVSLQLQAEHFELRNEAMGRVVLKGSAADAGFLHKGMGAIDAGDFKVGSLSVANNGMGRMTVNADKELYYRDNFSGKVRNVGAARAIVKVQ